MDDDQRKDSAIVCTEGMKNAGRYFKGLCAGLPGISVSWWPARYLKGVAHYVGTTFPCVGSCPPTSSPKANRSVSCGGELLAQGIHIQFAHRTFRWNNEARGVSAVHCVIVGFGRVDVGPNGLSMIMRTLTGNPHELAGRKHQSVPRRRARRHSCHR